MDVALPQRYFARALSPLSHLSSGEFRCPHCCDPARAITRQRKRRPGGRRYRIAAPVAPHCLPRECANGAAIHCKECVAVSGAFLASQAATLRARMRRPPAPTCKEPLIMNDVATVVETESRGLSQIERVVDTF